MSALEKSQEVENAVQVLQQIIQLYISMGPESMSDLSRSYLSSPPTTDSARNPTERLVAEAFRTFDVATDTYLRAFALSKGFDLAESENYRRRKEEGYFSGALYPFIVMFAIWLHTEGQTAALKNLREVFCSAALGTAGYVILDSNLDEGKTNPAEVMMSLAFIQEEERLILKAFEFDSGDYELLDRFKQMYLSAEIKEKRLRFKRSPYSKDHPEECGYKAVHAYVPFGLLLRKIGKENQIDDYLRFFYEWGAPLQIMDDLMDLEADIKNGHYSYPTIGFEGAISRQSPAEVASLIGSDVAHLKRLQQICSELIDTSRKRCFRLGASPMMYFVDILETRLDLYFSSVIEASEEPKQSAG